ncbi:DUF2283 domain-containing protein [bacterium]|nr:DUF2283 domain-containing protein [bacterium]
MAEMNILKSVPYLLTAPSPKIWVDYDDEADVLYISFHKPQRANDSIMEDNIIYHYRDEELVGITILRALATFGEKL